MEEQEELGEGAILSLIQKIKDKENLNINGPMCSGKSTFLQFLGEKFGYKIVDDWGAMPELAKLRPDDEAARSHWYADNWPPIAEALKKVLDAKGTAGPWAANLWLGPLQNAVNIYLDIENAECIEKERDWPKDLIPKHFAGMKKSLDKDWDYILNKEERDALEKELGR